MVGENKIRFRKPFDDDYHLIPTHFLDHFNHTDGMEGVLERRKPERPIEEYLEYRQGYEAGKQALPPPRDLNAIEKSSNISLDLLLAMLGTDKPLFPQSNPFLIINKDSTPEIVEDYLRRVTPERQTIIDRLLKSLNDKPKVSKGVPKQTKEGYESGRKKLAFRTGYLKGLKEFCVYKHSMNTDRAFQFISTLSLNAGLEGCLTAFEGKYPRQSTSGEQPNPVFFQGYRLGIVVKTVRDLGLVLDFMEAPGSLVEYDAFKAGSNGETQSSSVSIKVYFEDPNKTYHAGLRVWLSRQGIRDIPIDTIATPETLDAFKRGLEGRSLYGVNIVHPRTGEVMSFEEFRPNPDYLDDTMLVQRHEKPEKVHRAYKLGQYARLVKETQK